VNNLPKAVTQDLNPRPTDRKSNALPVMSQSTMAAKHDHMTKLNSSSSNLYCSDEVSGTVGNVLCRLDKVSLGNWV